jgi:hypothetical protein
VRAQALIPQLLPVWPSRSTVISTLFVVTMNLPPELLEEIIEHLPSYDKRTLRSCSLVTKSWIFPSQKRLFESVGIRPGNLQSWLDNISPTNVELLGHVRMLSYTEYPREMIGPVHLTLRDYFPSFRQLRRLTMCFTRISSFPQQTELFSAFQHTLSEICLWDCSVTRSAFVALINYFPNLACLDLRSLDSCKDDKPFGPLSQPLFKKLHATPWTTETMDLPDELSKLGVRFEEIVISSAMLMVRWSDFVKRIIGAFGASAKHLRMLGTFECAYNPP